MGFFMAFALASPLGSDWSDSWPLCRMVSINSYSTAITSSIRRGMYGQLYEEVVYEGNVSQTI